MRRARVPSASDSSAIPRSLSATSAVGQLQRPSIAASRMAGSAVARSTLNALFLGMAVNPVKVSRAYSGYIE